MHAIAIHLSPILGVEKNRTAFYIFAAALAAWAVIVSVGIGLRSADFPSSLGGQRLVIMISAILVLGTMASGVITSGTPAKTKSASSATSTESEPLTSSTASTPPAEASTPKATTGTPAPASSPAKGAAGTSLKLQANPEGQLAYNTKQLQAKAGRVTITMTNMAPEPHNVTIAKGSKVLGATPTFQGGSKTLTLKLKPGTYTFYCSVPGHRQAGMEGTLTVS
jgi:plastocyanin